MTYVDLYESGLSLPQVSEETGIPISTLRYRLNKLGVLRSRKAGVILASKNGRLGSGTRGKRRVFSAEWRENISNARKGSGRGWSLKPNGYIEITTGENKGRLEHSVLMEAHIGRRLLPHECVHHIDGNRSNNKIENLQIMTRSEHARHHMKQRNKGRENERITK